MKSLSKFGVRFFAAALAASFLVAGSVSVTAQAQDRKADAKGGNKLGSKVGKPLSEAVTAIQAKQFDVAMAKIEAARAVEKKTPYEEFKIDDMTAVVYAQTQKWPELIATWEKMLPAKEFHEPDRHAQLIRQLSIANLQVQNYPKTIEYGKQWLEANPGDLDVLNIVGQAAFQMKDFQQAREYMSKAVSAAENAGQVPKENWLKYLQSTSIELKDDAAITNAYGKLVRYYPKPETWERYLQRLSINERSDRVLFQWYRLMADLDVLKTGDQFAEYTNLALENALPGEAVRAAQEGVERKVFAVDGSKDKESQTRLHARAKQSAQADQGQLPQLEKEAQSDKATAGTVAGLGLAYFSFEQYDKAIAPLETGLKKGGLKNVEDYQLALGISQLKTGNKEGARATFESIPADSPLGKVARAWALRTYH